MAVQADRLNTTFQLCKIPTLKVLCGRTVIHRERHGLLCSHEGMDAAQRYRVAALDMGIGDSICRPRHWDDGRVGLPICNGWYYTWLGFSKCF